MLSGAPTSQFSLLSASQLITFKTPRPCVYCPTPSSSSWLASSRTETPREKAPTLLLPAGQPGLHGAPTPPPGHPLSSCLLSLIIRCSSPRSFSSFQPSAQACLRLLARAIACQGSAQGTEGWDSHSPVSLARMAHPEAWKGLGEPLGPQRGCV